MIAQITAQVTAQVTANIIANITATQERPHAYPMSAHKSTLDRPARMDQTPPVFPQGGDGLHWAGIKVLGQENFQVQRRKES